MARIFLTHGAEMLAKYYGARAVAALEALGEVRVNPTGEALSTAALVEHARGCDIIVSDRQTPGEATLFAQSPDLAAFLRCAVDIRNVDVAAASRHGVLVTHATAGFVASVAEMALGFMIALARHIPEAVIDYRAGREPQACMGLQLEGAVLGIIGFGAIGARLAALGAALGMQVLASDPHKTIDAPGVRQVAQDALLRDADFVVCLAVATEATENLMDAAAFARMKPGAVHQPVARQPGRRSRAGTRARRAPSRRRRARRGTRARPEAVCLPGRAPGCHRDAAHRRAHAAGHRAPGLRHRAPGGGARRRAHSARRGQHRRRRTACAAARGIVREAA